MNTTKSWSNYQETIFDFVANGTGHGVVEALAGSGKSTTLEECCRRTSKKVLSLAFNKDISEAMAKRVPNNTTVRTLHAYGFAAIKRNFPFCSLDKDRERKLALEYGVTKWDVGNMTKLVSMAKAWLIEDEAGLARLADAYQCMGPNPPFWIEAAQRILKTCKEQKPVTISYDDMVWLPVVTKMPCPSYDQVLVDETQDLNKAQVELALMAAGPNGRIIAVGDSRQAIYAFRGADSASMSRLTERLSATVMPLSITYRCPLSVVREAQQYVPQLEAAPAAKEGSVTTLDYDKLFPRLQLGDAIISRTNAPLVKVCLQLLREGTPAWIRGRDIGAGLTALIRKSKADNVQEFIAWIRNYEAKEIKTIMEIDDSDADEQIELVRDRVNTLVELTAGCETIGDVTSRIERLFQDKGSNDRVMLSSTHRAKGLEFENVFLLWDTYKPEHQRQEERNLCYVAITRAKDKLVYVTGIK